MTFKTRKEIKEWYDGCRSRIPLERRRKAKEGDSGHTRHDYTQITTYTVMDAKGNVIRRYENDESHITGASVKNLVSFEDIIKEIFEEGKENEYYVEKHVYNEWSRVCYDPDVSLQQMEEYRKRIEENESDAIKELERRIAKNERWKEACKWAKEHGVKYVSDRFNRFSTIRRNVIEAGLVEEWNAAWPEWSIGVDE